MFVFFSKARHNEHGHGLSTNVQYQCKYVRYKCALKTFLLLDIINSQMDVP